jgi:hypothetical protein
VEPLPFVAEFGTAAVNVGVIIVGKSLKTKLLPEVLGERNESL